jgi:hypothetical protein
MSLRNRLMLAALLPALLASTPAVALSDKPMRVDPPKPPRRRLQQFWPDERRSDISAHNEAIERRKAEKRERKAANGKKRG